MNMANAVERVRSLVPLGNAGSRKNVARSDPGANGLTVSTLFRWGTVT